MNAEAWRDQCTMQFGMSVLQDFKRFAFKGNVVDLAVAVVIGAALGKVISALVADLVMPVVGLLMPGGDWRAAGVVLRHAVDPRNDVVLRLGDFVGAVVDFLVVAMVLFAVVWRSLQAQKRAEAMKAASERELVECPFCLDRIPLGASRCRACAAELHPVAAPARPPTLEPGRPAPVQRPH